MLPAGVTAPRLEAQPVFGLPVRVPDPGGRKLGVFFVGDLGDTATLERLQDGVRDAELAGIAFVVVTRTPLTEARDLVPRLHLLFPVVCDPEGRTFDAWGIRGDAVAARLRGILRLDPRAAFSLVRRLPSHGFGAPFGAGLVDGEGRVRWSQQGPGRVTVPDLAGLMAAGA